jgi:hypothetical protein
MNRRGDLAVACNCFLSSLGGGGTVGDGGGLKATERSPLRNSQFPIHHLPFQIHNSPLITHHFLTHILEIILLLC